MAKTDIHKSSFDDGTQIKLHILKEYLKMWLPVFTKRGKLFWQNIYIYDFFAGEGTDIDGEFGSPLIILDELKEHCSTMKERNISCDVSFNEYDECKVKKLQSNIQELKNNCAKLEICPNKNPNHCPFVLNISNSDFQTYFANIYKNMSKNSKLPRFMFLDQYGIKQITNDIFDKLVKLDRTDFIFFISSSFANRFADMPEFKQYLNLSRENFDTEKPYHCHRVIFDYYKQLIPNDVEYYLAPFSIRKNNNIYGLIFGTHNKLGIEKFLKICWGINNQTGDANFDIDKENIKKEAPSLFEEFNVPTKIQYFNEELKAKIVDGDISTNKQMYIFAFDMGMLPKHANEAYKEMKKQGVIRNDITLATSNIHKIIEEKIILS